ncbi:low-density lipoprotein receptor class A domain-containing protein 1-like [Hemibagrus wyckioides]|uniref:low-density lipoprotein receptor class A domain-containing protein 1-like n=1 Tax=Hemibagrus wyckioides TaxID=337641 RepID=UPI00266C7BF2|nr:low-density lipoprotein receptor class A domain-containing protein 1-like [Hemibagrus wyckioides]
MVSQSRGCSGHRCCNRRALCVSATLLCCIGLGALGVGVSLTLLVSRPPAYVRDCLIAENASGFLCDDRVTCVPASGLCNGMSSCPDGADEDRLMCSMQLSALPPSSDVVLFISAVMDVFNADPMVRCGNPRVWIFADQKCNHMNDCGDCSDEVYASCPPCAGDWWSCDPTEFHFCSCVPRYFCNDGRHHCSDEHICPKT